MPLGNSDFQARLFNIKSNFYKTKNKIFYAPLHQLPHTPFMAQCLIKHRAPLTLPINPFTDYLCIQYGKFLQILNS
jgi:hypothetical protein